MFSVISLSPYEKSVYFFNIYTILWKCVKSPKLWVKSCTWCANAGNCFVVRVVLADFATETAHVSRMRWCFYLAYWCALLVILFDLSEYAWYWKVALLDWASLISRRALERPGILVVRRGCSRVFAWCREVPARAPDPSSLYCVKRLSQPFTCPVGEPLCLGKVLLPCFLYCISAGMTGSIDLSLPNLHSFLDFFKYPFASSESFPSMRRAYHYWDGTFFRRYYAQPMY